MKKDKRFEKISTDPKFKPVPKTVRKVKLDDDRFNAMFKDKNFISSTDIDEYGRKVKKGTKNIEMEKYYLPKEEKEIKDEELNEEVEAEEEESDTSEEFQEFLAEMQGANQQNPNDPLQDDRYRPLQEGEKEPDPTYRISILNIDWENIHAIDLFVLLNSFCPPNQKVKRVDIYPSEYGLKEMAKENEHGPDKEIFNEEAVIPSDNNGKTDETAGFDQVKLREYELKKLKYYYAIVTCDSPKTAKHLFTECDGLEIERTQSFMDIRYVPDELTEFPYKPKESCDHIPHDFDYVPKFRPNAALQDTKVKLTWDETDPKREELLAKAFKKEQFNEDDYNELLASSDSDDEEFANELQLDDDEEEEKDLTLLKKKRKMPKFKDGETIEIKFDKGFEGINEDVKQDEDDEKEEKSNWEKFKETKKNKRREKKMEERKRREEVNAKRRGKDTKEGELDLLFDKGKGKKGEFKFNPNDERFRTDNNPDFAVDPTSKDYAKLKKK